jgi:uncharacterized protein (TIGR02266 family)
MRIKLKYPDVETFIQKYAVNISRGGIFIATKTPKPVGTALKFEFLLAAGENGTSIIRGEGQVLWTREFDPSQPSKAHGMGIRFTRLDPESQAVVDRALAFRAQQAKPTSDAEERRPSDGEPSGPIPQTAHSPTPTPAPVTQPDPIPEAPTTEPNLQPMGRAPDEDTRPLPVDNTAKTKVPPLIPEIAPRTLADVTRPISLAQAEAEAERTKETPLPPAIPEPAAPPRVKFALESDPSREIRIRGASRSGALAELEQIARDWGISDESIDRVLKRRRPRMVEATAELERLLRKPPKPPTPSKAEALRGLRELLSRRAPVLEIDRTPRSQLQAAAAGGEPEQPPIKRAK